MTRAEGTEERERDERDGDLEVREGYKREKARKGVDFAIHGSQGTPCTLLLVWVAARYNRRPHTHTCKCIGNLFCCLLVGFGGRN